jgi:hypothetical protein
MARTPSAGCNLPINGVIQPGVLGVSSGFRSNGIPLPTINIVGGLRPVGSEWTLRAIANVD